MFPDFMLSAVWAGTSTAKRKINQPKLIFPLSELWLRDDRNCAQHRSPCQTTLFAAMNNKKMDVND